jgi:26S proteasome regulatory subunit N8
MGLPDEVVVHPLVLLSAVDHYNRVVVTGHASKRRVVGVLLGSTSKGKCDITNSYAGEPEERPRLTPALT